MRPFVWFLLTEIALSAAGHATGAEPFCGQMLVDGTTPPATTSYIYPRQSVTPFYQWENNDGYCGEVSLMIAGLSSGQWMSQFNARLICGTGLSQSGPTGACAAHRNTPNYNAQLLMEDPGTGVTGSQVFADAAQCMSNSRLVGATFDYSGQPAGAAGYQQYMAWVKAQVIAGNQVSVAVLINGGGDPQYDHEVAVIKIGTNHSPSDPTYYPDDVIYFDDHGVYTLSGNQFTSNPAIPPGAGSDQSGCTPYIFGYSFESLGQTRQDANKRNAQGYSIILPGNTTIRTAIGGTGYNTIPIQGPHNYAFSVAGPSDTDGVTLPVSLSIVGPTVTNGVENPRDPVAGYNYENPMIGTDVWGRSCTNTKPAPMQNFVLKATVSELTPGVAYNLYEYDFGAVSGTGSAAALKVPVSGFNANASMAAKVTSFRATDSTYSTSVTASSDKIIVFRCVPATAP